MRLTVCLEGNTEGRVLASVDMEEIVKMTITDDIEKSNFNPQMFKSCTDTAYQCGYEKGKADGFQEALTDAGIVIYTDKLKAFAEWLVNKGILGSRVIYNGEITDYGKVYLAEWQKEGRE